MMTTLIHDQYLKVREFHEVFGHSVQTELQKVAFEQSSDLTLFRISLINEEINELLDAYKNDDIVEVVDALADILYVVYGAGLVFGIPFDIECTAYPASSNSNSNSSPSPILTLQSQKEVLDNIIINDTDTSLVKLLEHLKYTTVNRDIGVFQNILYNIVNKVYEIAAQLHVPIDVFFDEVHRSNMTKVCADEQLAIDTVAWYRENEKRYNDPCYRASICGKYYVIYDKTTSKILKSIKYEKATIAELLRTMQ